MNTFWNNKICMAHKNNKNKNERCTREINKDSDFCRYHTKTAKYYLPCLDNVKKNNIKILNINENDLELLCKEINKSNILKGINNIKNIIDNNTKELNEKYLHNLLYMHSSWNDIPVYNRIYLQHNWWDINILINHFTQGLNHTELQNPYPTHPSNIFTRKLFKLKDLNKLKQRIKENDIAIHISLKTLLDYPNVIEKSHWNGKNSISHSILDLFKSKLRFKIINSKDSQNCFIGHWTTNNAPISKFESLYQQWHHLYIMDRNKLKVYKKMLSCPKEEWDPSTYV